MSIEEMIEEIKAEIEYKNDQMDAYGYSEHDDNIITILGNYLKILEKKH